MRHHSDDDIQSTIIASHLGQDAIWTNRCTEIMEAWRKQHKSDLPGPLQHVCGDSVALKLFRKFVHRLKKDKNRPPFIKPVSWGKSHTDRIKYLVYRMKKVGILVRAGGEHTDYDDYFQKAVNLVSSGAQFRLDLEFALPSAVTIQLCPDTSNSNNNIYLFSRNNCLAGVINNRAIKPENIDFVLLYIGSIMMSACRHSYNCYVSRSDSRDTNRILKELSYRHNYNNDLITATCVHSHDSNSISFNVNLDKLPNDLGTAGKLRYLLERIYKASDVVYSATASRKQSNG